MASQGTALQTLQFHLSHLSLGYLYLHLSVCYLPTHQQSVSIITYVSLNHLCIYPLFLFALEKPDQYIILKVLNLPAGKWIQMNRPSSPPLPPPQSLGIILEGDHADCFFPFPCLPILVLTCSLASKAALCGVETFLPGERREACEIQAQKSVTGSLPRVLRAASILWGKGNSLVELPASWAGCTRHVAFFS